MSSHVTREAGHIAITTLLSFVALFLIATMFNVGTKVDEVVAGNDRATTSVFVLNTPPNWATDAQELFPSSTATPTNVGTSTWWTAVGDDTNGENYFLLICGGASTAPDARENNSPVCVGPSTQLAVSATTTDNTVAYASRVALDGDAESTDWYAWICDASNGTAGTAKCNVTYKQGTGDTASPFKVNHRPTFTAASFTDTSPVNPGALLTWNTDADDADSDGGDDNIRLWVCVDNNFTAGIGCTGPGGEWASSSPTLTDPSAATTTKTPYPDANNYTAYGFIVDEHLLPASGGDQGANSVVEISNVAPRVATSSITLYDVGTTSDPLDLTVEGGLTSGYVVQFDVDDDNSCQTVLAGNEISSIASSSVYRSAVGGTYGLGCYLSSQYDVNNCYTNASSFFAPTCYRVPGTCSGTGDTTERWECIFSLWFTAENTVVGAYTAQDWRGAFAARDDDNLVGAISGGDTGRDLNDYMAFSVTQDQIQYGNLEPTQNTGTLIATTTLNALGNVGLDVLLQGDGEMCPTYPTCSGLTNNTIYANNQEYALGVGTSYGSGTDLSTTTSAELEINVPKSTATSSPANDDIYWGILVPGSINYSGDYVGRNLLTGKIDD